MTTQIVSVPLRLGRHPGDSGRGARRNEPVTFGVPFPKGVATADSRWSMGDAMSAAPAQTRVLDRWSDGSVRWLLVDAQVDLPDGKDRSLSLSQIQPNQIQTSPAVTATTTAAGVDLDTGSIRLAIRTGGRFPFEGMDLVLTDRNGREYQTVVRSARLRDAGPWRASVEIAASISGAGEIAELEVTATIECYAGSPTTRMAICVRNPRAAKHPGGFWDLGDAASILIKDATLRLAPAGTGDVVVSCSPEPGAPMTRMVTPFEVYQDSSGGENWQGTVHVNRERRVPTTFQGYRIRSGASETKGLRASPIVTVTRGDATVSASIDHFWQNFPKAHEVSPDGGLALRLFPGQFGDLHELQGGEQKTHVCYVALARDPVTELPLEWTRARLTCGADPAWTMSTGAIPWVSEDDPEHRALVWSAVDGPDTFEHKREVVDQYGWRNFGEVYGDHEAIRHKGPMPLVSHYNNQYDTVAGFLYQYLRTGDARWQTMAAELAAHVIDIDVYHTDRDKAAYNHGMFWHTYHYGDADTAAHRTHPLAGKGETHGGGPSPDHNYTTGLMLHHFLTGDEVARQTIIDLAQFVIDADDGSKTVFKWLSRANTGFSTASGSYSYHGPGRGPGNSLNALVDGHRLTGNAKFLEKAEQLIRRVVHPAEDVWKNKLDDPENKWFYLMFLQSLGKYLAHKAELGQLDRMYAYGRAALLHYARWMADHEYPYLEKPERLTFPTETWASHEVRKSDVFYLAALHASGAERDRFIERGAFFFQNSVHTLASMPTRTLARPVIVLLSSGLMHPWFQRAQPAVASLPMAGPEDFGQPVLFVPQRQIAMKRAKALVVAAGAIVVLMAGLVVYAFFIRSS